MSHQLIVIKINKYIRKMKKGVEPDYLPYLFGKNFIRKFAKKLTIYLIIL